MTAVGTDGKLWNTIDGHVSARWFRTDTPERARMTQELGYRNVSGISYTFTLDSDGDVWVARYTPAAPDWQWEEILG